MNISLCTNLIFTAHLLTAKLIEAVFIAFILISRSSHLTAIDIEQIHINIYSGQLNDSYAY